MLGSPKQFWAEGGRDSRRTARRFTRLLYDKSGTYHLAIYLSAITTFLAFIVSLMIAMPAQIEETI